MNRQIDNSYLLSCYEAWKHANKKEKGQLILRIQNEAGLGRTAIYKRFERLHNGESLTQASESKARGRSRKTQAIRKAEENAAFLISSIKMATKAGKSSYVMPTEQAIQVAINEGYLDGTIWHPQKHRSKVDRLMRQYGINHRAFEVPRAAVSWEARHVNEIWMVDASPLNKYYLNKKDKGAVTKRHFIAQDDKHIDDELHHLGLQKIWLYFAVDICSSAWYAKAFAPPSRGENAIDWRSFLIECFLEKKDKRIPFEGLPEILYSDQGSGVCSGVIRNMIRRLRCRPEAHAPGNSRAKGYVEGRISAFKGSFEPRLNFMDLRDLDQLNYYITAFMVEHNTNQGLYSKFLEGAMQHPIRKVSRKSIHDVTTTLTSRCVDAYGCVRITEKGKKQEYFIAKDIEKGTRLEIYRDTEGRVFAQNPKTGNIYNCDPYGRRRIHPGSYELLDGYKDWGHTDAEERRSKVSKQSEQLSRSINYDSLLPKESNITPLRAQGQEIVTHSPIPPKEFDNVAEAKLYICIQTGTRESEINKEVNEAIDDRLSLEMQNAGKISAELVSEIYSAMQDYLQEVYENEQTI